MALDLGTCSRIQFRSVKTVDAGTGFELTNNMFGHTSVLVGHLIYVIGGYGSLKRVYALDIKEWKWVRFSSFDSNFPRIEPALILVEDVLYVVSNDSTDLGLWRFDILSGDLTSQACAGSSLVPHAKAAAEYVEKLNMIIVYGGRVGRDPTNRVVGYNVASRVWKKLKIQGRVPPCYNHCSCMFSKWDILYFGGTPTTSLIPHSGLYHLNCRGGIFVWNEILCSPRPVARASSSMCAFGRRIFIYGGYPTDGTALSDHLYVLDIQTKKGVEFGGSRTKTSVDRSAPQVRFAGKVPENSLHSAVATSNEIIIVGGKLRNAGFVHLITASR